MIFNQTTKKTKFRHVAFGIGAVAVCTVLWIQRAHALHWRPEPALCGDLRAKRASKPHLDLQACYGGKVNQARIGLSHPSHVRATTKVGGRRVVLIDRHVKRGFHTISLTRLKPGPYRIVFHVHDKNGKRIIRVHSVIRLRPQHASSGDK